MPYPALNLTEFCELGVEDGSSPVIRTAESGLNIERKYRVLQSELVTAMTLLAGDVQVPLVPDGKFWRANPHECQAIRPVEALPALASDTTARYYCSYLPNSTGLKWTGETDDGAPAPTPPYVKTDEGNEWNWYEISANYERLIYPIKKEADIIWELERNTSIGECRLSSDYISLPGGILTYRDPAAVPPDKHTIPFTTGRVFPQLEVPITWHRIPQKNWYEPGTPLWRRLYGTSTFRSYIGTVNEVEFMGFPAGTLLFSGVSPHRRISPVGRIEWDLTLNMAYDPNEGWCKKYFFSRGLVEGASGWYLVLKANAAYPAAPIYENLNDDESLFNTRDFREIFWVADENINPFPP